MYKQYKHLAMNRVVAAPKKLWIIRSLNDLTRGFRQANSADLKTLQPIK